MPGKNVRMLGGKPLIAHSIEQAQSSGLFEAVVVDSDSEEILDVAREHGADLTLRRPTELATDEAGKIPVIHRAHIEGAHQIGGQFDLHVDLDATSPLRLVEDICNSIELLEGSTASNLVTGAPSRRSPYFTLLERKENGAVDVSKKTGKEFVRRQDVPQCYDMNASVYAWRTSVFVPDPRLFYDDTIIYVMPEERSIDIDSELDFDIVSFLWSRRGA